MMQPLIFPYVENSLGKLGVYIRKEPGEYTVMRKGGPWRERRCIDDLQEAYAYGLRLALLPPVYRSPVIWRHTSRHPQKRAHDERAYQIRRVQAIARRDEAAREKQAAAMRRASLIRDELAKIGVQQ